MDSELAGAVLRRWEEGLPVYEGTLYKAAEALGLDPSAALMEARYYTHLDAFLGSDRPLSLSERELFSAAAGFDVDTLEKTAAAYGQDSDLLLFKTLASREWVPDLEKIALLAQPMPDGAAQQPGADQQAMDQQAAGGQDPSQMMAAGPPQPGQQVQQNPMVRPSPTAPEQIPASAGGNLNELLQGASQAPAAESGGGLPPAGMGAEEPPPPPPTGEDKIKSVWPDIDPDTLTRYAPQLDQFEQQMGMSIQDPKQIEKFIKELQKVDKKVIDEGIKQLGEQLAQESGMGAGSGFDNTAPKPLNQTSNPGEQNPQQAMAKAAHAGRMLAHVALNRR